ncbi:PREDICTED: zinc finger protein 117-like isoform X2 [Papilio polytes]|uniref:zinc finger protein 117-like isoform X2 n=1 Tax=Papilio polytes TaxID=76194 RepID=UPI000675BED0|nr:PREDICTED: zinc finger protein 117-like isoform X2 [Papilio polytes]
MSYYDKRCRICLQDEASYPIFEKVEDLKNNNIQSKISTCLHVNIEDVEGYPRQICNNCNETLDVLCNFINVFKQSCKTLETKLIHIKIENASSNYDSDFGPEISIKEESPDLKDLDDKTLPTKVNSIHSRCKEKKVVKKVLPKKQIDKEKINTVASSILEGEFTWSGEQCLNKKESTQTAIQQTEKKIHQVKKKQVPKGKKQPPPKLCDLCGEVFEQDKLVSHMKRVHLNSPAKCPVCARICCSQYYLNRHIQRRHQDNKKYPCKSCEKSFAFIGELRSHIKYVHEKIRKTPQIFPCDMCERTFKCLQSLTIHRRSVHTGERPEKCSVCGAGFYHVVYLREHMRLHTGETPYKCPICDRGYAQRGNMRSHLRIHRKSELDAATLSKIKPRLLRFLKA